VSTIALVGLLLGFKFPTSGIFQELFKIHKTKRNDKNEKTKKLKNNFHD
jgi:hypothetical protein